MKNPLKSASKDEVTVFVGNAVYKMSKDGLKGVLALARKNVKNGVYAAQNKNTVIMMNEPNIGREKFRALCREFNKKGFVLLHTRGASND